MRELGLPIVAEDRDRAEDTLQELEIVPHEVIDSGPIDDGAEQISLLEPEFGDTMTAS